MVQWSNERNTTLARFSPKPWYRVDTVYSSTMVPPNTAADTSRSAVGRQVRSSHTRAPTAYSAETPWLTAEKISSPKV